MSGTPSVEDEGTMDTCSSGPATPMAPSNPGTPRSVHEDYRSTPPPTTQQMGPISHSASTSSLAGLSHSASSSSLVTQVAVPRGGSKSQAGFSVPGSSGGVPQSKYSQLLAVIEDLGKDIRPTYSGSRTSAERLKRGIVHSRILVRECLMECERAARS